MTGEKDLEKLLSSMSPTLLDGEYVFCTFPNAHYGDHFELAPIASFIEPEGLSLVVPKSKADEQGLSYACVFKGITLSVHSSLEAVGLTAAVSRKLTEHGISANVIAGYYHDHIFVPKEHVEKAIETLNEFAR
ncbi:MAG: ACT domain-containing protein [Desulfobacteraceae bacterium]|nr:ACT domain-containing protein [Desulfobacteraceae bacterium]MBC2751395.1 ACT domain-containing protein [Desulfobacteraceae bacterium]